MKIRVLSAAMTAAFAGGALLGSTAFAVEGTVEDFGVGEQVDKSMSRSINPEDNSWEADHAFIKYMRFYVPAQTASGLEADTNEDGTLGVSYNDYDGDDASYSLTVS